MNDKLADNLAAGLRAIIARIEGRFDDPDLMKYGPLVSDPEDDIAAIARGTLAEYEDVKVEVVKVVCDNERAKNVFVSMLTNYQSLLMHDGRYEVTTRTTRANVRRIIGDHGLVDKAVIVGAVS